MFISVILLALMICGGTALTYLVAREKPLMWRLSAGTIVGSAVLGLVTFLFASVAGFVAPALIAAVLVTLSPVALLQRTDIRNNFKKDWARAKGKLQGANASKLKRFAYYGGFFLLFLLFFNNTMFMSNGAITTGGSQNLGDLPYHLGTIFSFTEANNFPVINPSWAGAKYTYPFVADMLSAVFVKLGADVISAMFVQNLAWAFSLFVLFESFVATITCSKLAGRIAPVLLVLSGGLGFLWLNEDMTTSGKGLYDLIWALPRDYTIGDKLRWGNSMVVLFMTQRSLLLGMPLTVLVLGYLWRVFKISDAPSPSKAFSQENIGAFAAGLLAGTLPLIHMHSLVVLFVVTAFLFAMRPKQWMRWIAFGIGTALIAVPELVWLMTGTATETTKFFDWHFGWDKREMTVGWFWLMNTGLLFPLLGVGIWLYLKGGFRKDGADETIGPRRDLVLFYVPFAVLFIVANVAKLAPWEWDNIKILIYWFAASLPFVALAVAYLWQHGHRLLKVFAGICVFVLVASGSLDVWRTASGQIKYGVFEKDAVSIAEQIREKTDPKAIFLNAPTFNSPVVLTGRQSVMRYSGHLSSHGINYLPREAEVKQIYSGGAVADVLLNKYNVDYVIFTPEERGTLKANEEYFKKYPVIAEAGQYRVYKIK